MWHLMDQRPNTVLVLLTILRSMIISHWLYTFPWVSKTIQNVRIRIDGEVYQVSVGDWVIVKSEFGPIMLLLYPFQAKIKGVDAKTYNGWISFWTKFQAY